jgi:signal transduction histidine kinase
MQLCVLQYSIMKTNAIDQGLLAVFRLFTLFRLVFAALGIGMEFAGLRAGELQLFSWLSLLEASLLLAYLSWPWARRQLGEAYLPIALAAATLGPMLVNLFTGAMFVPADVRGARTLVTQWQSFIVLLAPLILISWRYSFGTVIAYSLGLVLLDLAPIILLPYPPFPVLPILPILFVSAIFRAAVYLLIGYAIHRLGKELRQQNLNLEQANRRLSNYALMTEQLAVSRERNRLAHELHDTVAHTLSGLAVQLEAAQTLWDTQPAQAQQTLQSALAHTRHGLSETRRAIQALRASPLEDLGLCMALEQLARGVAERDGVQLILDLPETLPQLSPDAEHSLYRIAEEALRNIEQHASAKKIEVSLRFQDGRVGLQVRDDGAGFDPGLPVPEDRFGILGMQERAQAVGGQLQVESLPGQGTCVQLWMEV